MNATILPKFHLYQSSLRNVVEVSDEDGNLLSVEQYEKVFALLNAATKHRVASQGASTHVPGPWRFVFPRKGTWTITSKYGDVAHLSRGALANVKPGAANATAYLIAAAPEMYAALKAVEEWVATHITDHDEDCPCAVVDAAICKAEGKRN